ncbi:hypothetical protein HMPREF2874_06845 [Rothia sp. HMSC068F09]|nr:hypothetical protein HMPREF2874_06845 [Rothia sp. HMSC068F09]
MLAGVSFWTFEVGSSRLAMGGGIRPAEFVCRVRVCYLEEWARKLVHRHINFNFRKLYMVIFQAYAVPVPFQGEYAEVLTMLLKHLTQTSQMLIR